MNATEILRDQTIVVKKGRTNGLGFEPAFNAYFDFYLNPKYFGEPLLQLEDVTFHLFLRKNLNDSNPAWKMPSIRQMKKRLSIGQPKIDAMMKRLDAAHLLRKESGVREGNHTISNNYILSDPIPTLEEFLLVANEGLFGKKPCTYFEYTSSGSVPILGTPPVPILSTPSVPDLGTHKQTLKTEQTLTEQIWDSVLKTLKLQLPSASFSAFLQGTTLQLENSTALVTTPNTFSIDWLQNRMSKKLLFAINQELRMLEQEDNVREIRFLV